MEQNHNAALGDAPLIPRSLQPGPAIAMQPLRLVPADFELPSAPSPRLRRGMDGGFAAGDDPLKSLEEVLNTMSATSRPALWGVYFAVSPVADVATCQGICGFKDGPDTNGSVEIAYYTFPAFEGQGIAKLMASRLVALAEGAVSMVIAHTLPVRNASTSVLLSCGFTLKGPVEDPEDGTVWRWELNDI